MELDLEKLLEEMRAAAEKNPHYPLKHYYPPAACSRRIEVDDRRYKVTFTKKLARREKVYHLEIEARDSQALPQDHCMMLVRGFFGSNYEEAEYPDVEEMGAGARERIEGNMKRQFYQLQE